MPASKQQPVWQRTRCPSWCVVEHRNDDHMHDRRHQSKAIELPVLAVSDGQHEHSGGRDQWHAVALIVCLQLRDGTDHTEVYIGDGIEQRIAIDVPSALRLAENLGSIVRDLTTSWSDEASTADPLSPGR